MLVVARDSPSTEGSSLRNSAGRGPADRLSAREVGFQEALLEGLESADGRKFSRRKEGGPLR